MARTPNAPTGTTDGLPAEADDLVGATDGDVDWVEDSSVDDYEFVVPEVEWDDDDEENYVYVPEDRGVVRKITAVVVSLFIFVFLVLGLGGYWLYSQVNPSGSQAEQVQFIVPKDAGLATISRLLEEKEIITNATIFRYYAKSKNIPGIRAGEYDGLYKNDSMDHVIERLKQGPLPPKFTELTFAEGLWLNDTLQKITEKYPEMANPQAMKQAADTIKSKYRPANKPLDGLLFPAGYRVTDADKGDPQKLIDQMVKKFEQVGDEIGLQHSDTTLNGVAGKTHIGPYEVIIVASLVEAEAKVPEDRARVARVIYNRLKMTPNEPIGIDATVLYALGEHKQEITKTDLDIESPFNLRKKPGLTPNPINSPGKESLLAALNPSTEPGSDKWLYYVLIDKEGHHLFTGNYNEFLRASQNQPK